MLFASCFLSDRYHCSWFKGEQFGLATLRYLAHLSLAPSLASDTSPACAFYVICSPDAYLVPFLLPTSKLH